MGCWDIFCFICGNTCHGPLDDNIEDDEDDSITPECTIKFKWLSNCIFLTQNNQIAHQCEETSCNIEFSNRKGVFMQMGYDKQNYIDIIDVPNGVFLHSDCWNFIKKEFGIELKFGNLPITKINSDRKIFDNVNYKPIEQYWGQNFNFKNVCKYKRLHYLCESPLKNSKSASRVKKIFNQLKIRTNRKSPACSASFYKTGSIKIGEDGNFWKIIGGKWMKMNGKLLKSQIECNIKNKNELVKINKLPQIGFFNDKPIFVESYGRNKKSKDKIYVNVVYLDENN